DIDVVWLYGYGWPIYRGGPMFWADTVGLKHIPDRLSYYAKETNDPSLAPAPLLKHLTAEGKTCPSLAAEKSKAAGCAACFLRAPVRGGRIAANPESRDSGFALRAPGNDGAPRHDPPRRTVLSRGRALERSASARHAARPAVEGGCRVRRSA